MYKKLSLLVFACFAVSARIDEIQTIADFLHEVNQETRGQSPEDVLIIFDIDNTLACPPSNLGADQWFEYMVRQKQQEGHSLSDAITLVLPKYFYVHFTIPLRAVEHTTCDVVHALQQRNFNVICLTARSVQLAERTSKQLAHIGLSFSMNSVPTELALTLPQPALYHQGIIFCGLNTKDAGLTKFFDRIGFYPKKIIMIDDKIKYLHAVENSVQKLGIDFVGLRYGFCDIAVQEYNHAVTEAEWNALRNE